MSKSQITILTTALLAQVLFVGGRAAVAVDVVTRLSDGTTLRGKLGRMDSTSVEIERTNGQKVEVSVDDLKSVVFEGEPSQIAQARSNERSGAYATALEKLNEARSSLSSPNRNAKINLEFLIARVKGRQALLDASKIDDAITELNTFREANKGSFRYLEATLLQAALHGAKKEADQGKTLLAEVQASAVPGFKLQAGVDLGNLLLKSGDAAGALSAFDGVISQCQGKPGLTRALYSGKLGRAACLKTQNNVDDALLTLDEVIEKAAENDSATLAEAWLRKGDCMSLKGNSKAALMAYLHVDVLYSGEGTQHAEALARLAQLWGPSGHEDRALEASAKLAERYPNSIWARQSAGGG